MPAKLYPALAALAATSLAAAPAAAQPPQPPAEQPQEEEARGGFGGDSIAFYALPLLIVIALLIAALNDGDSESP